jgi:8-oxo-dGTP diphosphatase
MVGAMEIKLGTDKAEMPLLVAAAVIFDGDRVLITRRPADKRHPGFWEFPGGKVDPGESPEEALHRELKEELDVEIEVKGIYEVVHHRYDWGAVLILAYECRLVTNTIRNLGVAEYCWIVPREMANFNILPADQPIIARLNA